MNVWSLSARDKLGDKLAMVLSTRVEPLYKGQVLCALWSGTSLQGTSPMCLMTSPMCLMEEPLYKGQVLCALWSGTSLQGTSPMCLMEWNLSTRDKSYVPYGVESLVNGSHVPLYKGQVGGRSYVPHAVKPFYKGQVGSGSLISTVPL